MILTLLTIFSDHEQFCQCVALLFMEGMIHLAIILKFCEVNARRLFHRTLEHGRNNIIEALIGPRGSISLKYCLKFSDSFT